MSAHRAFVAAFLLLLAGLSAPQSPSARAQPADPVLVIMAAGASRNIPLSTLRNAFESYPTDFGGRRLIPFNQPTSSPARVRFDRAILGLTPDQVGRFWTDQRVRTGSQPPRSIPSGEMTLRVVASLPGGIAYVAMDPDDVPEGVQVLAIDGKGPRDPGYPLAD